MPVWSNNVIADPNNAMHIIWRLYRYNRTINTFTWQSTKSSDQCTDSGGTKGAKWSWYVSYPQLQHEVVPVTPWLIMMFTSQSTNVKSSWSCNRPTWAYHHWTLPMLPNDGFTYIKHISSAMVVQIRSILMIYVPFSKWCILLTHQ